MKERIAEFIREQAYKPMTFAELASAMGISERQHIQLQKTLEQMETTGEVVRTRLERFGAPERMNLAVGRLQGHPKGFGFLVQDDPSEEDIFIGRESLNGAWHGDRIMARLSPPPRGGGRVEGEVIRILARANQKVVGTFESAKNAGYVTPDDRRLAGDIIVSKGATNGAKSGEKVVVQIVTWPEARRNAEGKVIERIGMKGQVGVDIVSVIRKFGLPEAFPPKVLAEAATVADIVEPEALEDEGRRDLRDWTIVTIDGEDAKDLDDAVNVERISENKWRLGVHIADVSYYVREGTALDQEAFKRATSVYLADRVVPMLPPSLSNGICSLNPDVDRLTLSCVMEINNDGKVLHYEIFPSVIQTAARMTYSKVNAILASDENAIREYAALVPMFTDMLSLMEVLRIKRGRRGAMDFDLPEAKVKLNDSGWPIEILRVDRGVSERIIEEFMLVANETVAEHCNRAVVPFMYRVHAEPASDRVAGLREFLGLFGYTLKVPQGNISPKLLQEVTDWSRGRPEENLINTVLLRTMKQAVYSADNLGHFGLAADYYCHFTSPIRRYPDLVVHRVLRAMLAGGVNPRLRSKWERWMPEAARQSSERERVAVEAERETVELKKAEFMSDKVGETFTGFISGVSPFGFFVQLPNTVEGLVHVSNLTNDYYHFHEKYYALIGERTRRRFRLGDTVVVRLTRVDVDSRQVDFMIVMDESPVDIVAEVPGETRNRAAKKRVLSGGPLEATPSAPEPGGRTRKRRRMKGAVPGATHLSDAPPIQRAVEFGAIKEPLRRSNLEEPVIERVERPERLALPERQPLTERPILTERQPLAERPLLTERQPLTEQPLLTERQPLTERPRLTVRQPLPERRARIERPSEPAQRPRVGSSRTDMWGVPVPGGRVQRVKGEDDPGVVSPFSIKPPPARDRGGRGGRAFAEAPFAPAPATADESAGLPALADEGAALRPSRGRRPQRGRGPRRSPQLQPTD